MSSFRFVADGHGRAMRGFKPQMEEVRKKIKQDMEAKYAAQIADAGFLDRNILLLKMKNELRRRVAQAVSEIKATAPPDALY